MLGMVVFVASNKFSIAIKGILREFGFYLGKAQAEEGFDIIEGELFQVHSSLIKLLERKKGLKTRVRVPVRRAGKILIAETYLQALAISGA